MPPSIASAAVGSRSRWFPTRGLITSHPFGALCRTGDLTIATTAGGRGRVLSRFGHRQGEWCITYKADDPSDIVDPNVGMCPLKLQSRLRSLEKPPRFGIAHDPLTSLLLPSRTGTYFAPEIDKCRAPDKSNGWHALRPPHVQSRESYGIDESRCNTFERNVRSISTDMVAAQMRYC